MTYIIAEPCVDIKDRACVDECPVDCIYEGTRMLYIHPEECVDCGACEPVCPVEAIFYEDDLPEKWSDYYKANVGKFEKAGINELFRDPSNALSAEEIVPARGHPRGVRAGAGP